MSMKSEQANSRGEPNFGSNWPDKIRLLEAIDAMREEVRRIRAAELSLAGRGAGDSLETLRQKLRVYENTCALLEREIQEMEQQTLAALAEARRLRRELDRRETGRREAGSEVEERVRQAVAEAENERRLLLDALENSEAELARMVRTLDQVARRLQVA
ncbi:MAG: hypothetical protein LBU64_04130 [Planctomycetota bacterium]|jgi:chromosome segregation ATPase|nr:hypothetical protein [Planctomycetota bacterium]